MQQLDDHNHLQQDPLKTTKKLWLPTTGNLTTGTKETNRQPQHITKEAKRPLPQGSRRQDPWNPSKIWRDLAATVPSNSQRRLVVRRRWASHPFQWFPNHLTHCVVQDKHFGEATTYRRTYVDVLLSWQVVKGVYRRTCHVFCSMKIGWTTLRPNDNFFKASLHNPYISQILVCAGAAEDGRQLLYCCSEP